jgi:hypothetical protein
MQQVPARAEECSTVVKSLLELQTSKSTIPGSQRLKYVPSCLAAEKKSSEDSLATHEFVNATGNHALVGQCYFEADSADQ